MFNNIVNVVLITIAQAVNKILHKIFNCNLINNMFEMFVVEIR